MEKQPNELNSAQFLTLTLILGEQQCHRCARIAKENDIRGGIVVIGKGTVKSAVLNLLGIKNQKKQVVTLLLEKGKAESMLEHFTKELQLHEPGHGIAYTTPVVTANQIINSKNVIMNTVQCAEEESMFKKLTVIVDRGMAEDVMDIARRAGVNGGTIMHGRGTGAEVTAKLFGMDVEPEKELVMMLMKSDLVDKVVSALYQELQLDIPGKGVLFVEPIVQVRGLFDSHRAT